MQRESTEFNQSSGNNENQRYKVSSMKSLSVVGSRTTSKWSLWYGDRHDVQKQGRKIILFQLSGDISALHHRKNPYSCSPKQIGAQHRWTSSTRNSVWVQSQQGHHRHDIRPQTTPREIQGAERTNVCTLCSWTWPKHLLQWGTMVDHGALRLPTKFPLNGYRTAKYPVRPC